MFALRQLSARECHWLFELFGEDFSSCRFDNRPLARRVARWAGAEGITFGRLVCLRRANYDDGGQFFSLVAHELAHVVQYRRLGAVRFLRRYLLEYLGHRGRGLSHHCAYLGISLEEEARDVERRAMALRAAARGALDGQESEGWLESELDDFRSSLQLLGGRFAAEESTAGEALDFATPQEGSAERDLVGVLDVASDGHAER